MKTSQKFPKSSKTELSSETTDITVSATKTPTVKLPAQYQFLNSTPLPALLAEAIKHYGVVEKAGKGDSPTILGWAAEIGGWISKYYTKDETPWCGLFMAYCAKMAGFSFGQRGLAARDWIDWGKVGSRASLGDVLVFSRTGGGHVGIYVGEDDDCYHVLGGNQSDKVCIARMEKQRLLAVRRAIGSKLNIESVKPIMLAAVTGKSVTEA